MGSAKLEFTLEFPELVCQLLGLWGLYCISPRNRFAIKQQSKSFRRAGLVVVFGFVICDAVLNKYEDGLVFANCRVLRRASFEESKTLYCNSKILFSATWLNNVGILSGKIRGSCLDGPPSPSLRYCEVLEEESNRPLYSHQERGRKFLLPPIMDISKTVLLGVGLYGFSPYLSFFQINVLPPPFVLV